MKTSEELAASIHSLTRTLIEQAQEGELSSFYETLRLREQVLSELETHIQVSGNNERTEVLLIEARTLNEQLQQSLNQEQKRLLDERSKLQQGDKMRKAYGENR